MMGPAQTLMDFAPPARPSIEERFQAFHEANPHVYRLIVARARALKAKGVTRYGVKRMVEQLRWDDKIETEGEAFRVNNDFTRPYAEKVMRQCPDLAGFFETRERKTSNA